jgi:hypothetical protein
MAKKKVPDLFQEFLRPTDDYEEYQRNRESDKSRRARKRRADELNEVGLVPNPSEEILELRRRYSNHPDLYYPAEHGIHIPSLSPSPEDMWLPDHYVKAHSEIYVNSTGLKPLGKAQIDSTHHSQIIIQHGGRIVKAEPRGFGKTSRSCNEFLLGVLQGYISYGLIICSSLEKAEEIILSLITEILENEKLAQLYPREVACFTHAEANPRKADMQTYDGNFTHINFNTGLIRFPVLPDSASSGAVLNIRTKKNVRGIYFTDRSGAYAGVRRRPTHVLLDDIQTDEEAGNPNTARKLVTLIKKSILRSGGHAKRLAAMMTCTPIAPEDVSHHFLLKEPWQHVIYKMLEKRSDREDLWFGEYAERLMNFARDVPGSQIKAALWALEFYREHQAEMDSGAEASWEWCYEYDDDPQLEISAVQHAYNIMILEGMEVFESECQCNVISSQQADDITYCTADHIAEQINNLPRNCMAVEDRFVVTHIDCGFDYLTYVTMSSPATLEAKIIDYGTYPHFPHRFEKGKTSNTLRKVYPDIPQPEHRLTQAVYDLTNLLMQKQYKRQDGVLFKNNCILVDEGHFQPHIHKAIRMSIYNTIHPAHGLGINARDKQLEQRSYSDGTTKYHYCVLTPIPDRTLMKLMADSNYFKCQVHIGFSRQIGQPGAISIFAEEFPNQHIMIGEHCTAEIPTWDIDPRTDNRTVVWTQTYDNNEFFDNTYNCLAAFAFLGVTFDVQESSEEQSIDINDFIRTYS